MELKEIIGQKFERTAVFERSSIDQKKRTVALSFSSEEPYERYWGVEILDHGRDSVILDRLRDGAPLLVNHDTRDQVGVLEQAIVGGDRRGRAVVRFGRSQRAEEIFQDVVDGIRSKVSVGYRIHKMVLEKEEEDKRIYRVTSWEPFEVSLVAIPADNSVGVGRSEERVKVMENGNVTVENEEKRRPREIRREARFEALGEVQDIIALGRRHGMLDEANRFIENGRSLDDFRNHILAKLARGANPIQIADPENGAGLIGLSGREIRQYSVLKLIRAQVFGRENPAAYQEAAFELECHRAAVKQQQALGVSTVRGFCVPLDVLGSWTRELSAGGATAGAELVATNLMAGSFIDVLRNQSVCLAMGARSLAGLSGNVAIPRKTSGSTAGWITPEGSNAALSEPTFDQIVMSPKTLGAYSEITRQLLLQSSLDMENLVRMDLAQAVATEIDRACLYGTGANGQPRGIRNQTGINMPTPFAGAVPTWAEVVAMESAVAVDNALTGRLGYVIEPAMAGSLKTSPKVSGYPVFILGDDGRVNGHRCMVSSQTTAGDVFFGNWADLLIGFWGALDILIDPYTNSLSGTLRIVVHQSCDAALRHAVSFAFNNDSA